MSRVVESMKVIPQPEEGTRSILTSDNAPVIRGKGEGKGTLSLACGSCGAILVENVHPETVRYIVILCPDCRKYNDTE